MRAAVFDAFGPPDVLRIDPAHALPQRRPGEVFIKAVASSVNPIDWKTRAGEVANQWCRAFVAARAAAALCKARDACRRRTFGSCLVTTPPPCPSPPATGAAAADGSGSGAAASGAAGSSAGPLVLRVRGTRAPSVRNNPPITPTARTRPRGSSIQRGNLRRLGAWPRTLLGTMSGSIRSRLGFPRASSCALRSTSRMVLNAPLQPDRHAPREPAAGRWPRPPERTPRAAAGSRRRGPGRGRSSSSGPPCRRRRCALSAGIA